MSQHLWSEAQAEALRSTLCRMEGEEGALGYCELAGFLFAVVCSPDMVKPSEWMPEALRKGTTRLRSAEMPPLLDLLMQFYNHINEGVFEARPALPAGIPLQPDVMRNFGPDAPLGKWALGYAEGQGWLDETWDACIEELPENAEALCETLDRASSVLCFFSSREDARQWMKEAGYPGALGSVADEMLERLPEAMLELAVLGRRIEDEVRKLHTPARSTKVGRNEPCPCGSGRKYKVCCGASV